MLSDTFHARLAEQRTAIIAAAQPVVHPKRPCQTCGYECAERCRVHPDRVAHKCWWGTWVCHECDHAADQLIRNGLDSKTAVQKLLEARFVLCPGCAYDEAIFEDAQRELEEFLHEVDNTVRGGFE